MSPKTSNKQYNTGQQFDIKQIIAYIQVDVSLFYDFNGVKKYNTKKSVTGYSYSWEYWKVCISQCIWFSSFARLALFANVIQMFYIDDIMNNISLLCNERWDR